MSLLGDIRYSQFLPFLSSESEDEQAHAAFQVRTSQSTLYIVLYTTLSSYSVQCVMYSIQCIMYFVQCIMYNIVQSTLYIVQSTMTLYNV